ncbi:unnamed protein product [Durusdinium trenchii]|uniref:TauD/TfdA-like domain-containing protein n=1 Tax=Durusdinium trenchii TaxID=1381693 RepID=A0ABP0LU17_9DINO
MRKAPRPKKTEAPAVLVKERLDVGGLFLFGSDIIHHVFFGVFPPPPSSTLQPLPGRCPVHRQELLRWAAVLAEPAKAAGQPRALAIYRTCDRDPTPRGQDFWHSDNSYAPEPAGPTLLYALKVPQGTEGPLGDTLFLDAGLKAVRPHLEKAQLEQMASLRARHNLAHNAGHPLAEFEDKAPADACHPVLRQHPITGEEVVFVNEAYVHRIDSMSQEQSQSCLKQLLAALQRAPGYRHRWREGDVLVWDNHRLQHKATTLQMPKDAERVMWRVQTHGPGLAGDESWDEKAPWKQTVLFVLVDGHGLKLVQKKAVKNTSEGWRFRTNRFPSPFLPGYQASSGGILSIPE